jgi:LmbE family N-acetylglucosaminyl deacetylase
VPACILHLSPHPDDEAIGAIATLLALRERGHRVINVACSLGRADERARREREVREACDRAGFELDALEPPLPISADDDLDSAQRRLTREVAQRVTAERVDLVVSPSPHDGHHGHEVVGRAIRDAVRATGVRWWMWGLWADLPRPTLYTGFDRTLLDRAVRVLEAHAGELARNDYAALLPARAVVSRVLGSERVFGWGCRMRPEPYAELLTEVALDGDGFTAGEPRVLDSANPLPPVPTGRPLGWWLDAPSVADRARAAGW